jgi:cytochrome c553
MMIKTKQMKKYLFLATAALTVSIYACKHEPDVIVPQPPSGGGTSEVCFEADVLPLFQTNCAKSGCHDAASRQDGYVLDSYSNIIKKGIVPANATNSKIYKVLFETGNDQMPPPPNAGLSSAQKAIIGKWINEGAKNTVSCGTACDSNSFKFAANINPIIQRYCVGCHGGSSPSGGINLSVYGAVRAQALTSSLYGAVTHSPGYSPMPKNAPKLSDCQIAQIRKWIDAGSLNN